jgi:hypothetical protein
MTTPRDEAVAWLVGQLRFERLLTDLRGRSEEAGGPVDLAGEPVPAPAPARAA